MKTISIICCFLFASQLCIAQESAKDTSTVLSITIFNKKEVRPNHIPDVFPNISNLRLISNTDTIECYYEFPFLKFSKLGFDKVRKSHPKLVFSFTPFNNINSSYTLSIPIKFPLTYSGAKFLVIEHYDNHKFFAMQQWGSTLFTGEQIEARRIR